MNTNTIQKGGLTQMQASYEKFCGLKPGDKVLDDSGTAWPVEEVWTEGKKEDSPTVKILVMFDDVPLKMSFNSQGYCLVSENDEYINGFSGVPRFLKEDEE